MKKTELQELVQECIAEVLAERATNEGYDEFQRADKGSKGVAAKDKAEEDTYGAGYAAGEKAAKAKYKKLAEAYKQLKEEGFGLNKDPYESKKLSNLINEDIQADYSEHGVGLLAAELYDFVDEYFVKAEPDMDSYFDDYEDKKEYYKDLYNKLPQRFTIIPTDEQGTKPMNIVKTPTGFTTDFWNSVDEARFKKDTNKGEKQINEIDMQEILPALIASGFLTAAGISAAKQAIKDPKQFFNDIKKQGKLPNKLG